VKRLGKLVIMQETEYKALVYAETRTAELISARDEAVALARKFHAAGGYSHRLPAVKEQLSHATESLAHCIDLLVAWRPLVASLETTPGQFVDRQFDTKVSVTRELCGIDEEWKKPDMTREEFESLYQGNFNAPPPEPKIKSRVKERPEQFLIDRYFETGKTFEEREAERRQS